MGYNSNTKVLTDPIGLASIAKCLGENTTSLKNLACSPLINPKSKYKPMRYPADGSVAYFKPLTKTEQDAVNYGIKINSYAVDGDYRPLVEMAQAIEKSLDLTDTTTEGKAFYYDRLLASNENDVGRISDFWNYNHLAGDWFNVVVELNGVVNTSTARFRLQFGEVLGSFGDLKAWGAYNDLFEESTGNMTAAFGFIMRSKESTWSGDSKFYNVLNLEDILQLNGTLIEFTPTMGAGEWIIYPILVGGLPTISSNTMYEFTDFKTIEGAPTFVPLPYSQFTSWIIGATGTDNIPGDDTELFFLENYIDGGISVDIDSTVDTNSATWIFYLSSIAVSATVQEDVELNNQISTDFEFRLDSATLIFDMGTNVEKRVDLSLTSDYVSVIKDEVLTTQLDFEEAERFTFTDKIHLELVFTSKKGDLTNLIGGTYKYTTSIYGEGN